MSDNVIVFPSGRTAREIVDGYKPSVATAGNHTTFFTPTREECEAALLLGIDMLGMWQIWRCGDCGGPGAGGLACPTCGLGPFAPWWARRMGTSP